MIEPVKSAGEDHKAGRASREEEAGEKERKKRKEGKDITLRWCLPFFFLFLSSFFFSLALPY